MTLSPPPPPPPERPLPTREQLEALDVPAFLHRLDGAVAAIDTDASLADLLPADDAPDLLRDPRFARAETVLRTTLRGLIVTTSLRDLPEPARVHPGVQDRVFAALDDMDAALAGLSDALASLTPAERAAVTRAMREEPDLAESVLAVLDAEAARAGVSPERRAHLQSTGRQACFRLRQSTAGFIDEYTDMVRRAQPRDAATAERWLALHQGGAGFAEERAWQLAVHAQWQGILAAPAGAAPPQNPDGAGGAIYRPPPPPPPPPPPRRGTRTLQAAGVLFGLGLVTGGTGVALVNYGDSNTSVTGLFVLTGAALLGIAGTICLLVGAILRLADRR